MIGGALRRIVTFNSKQQFWPSNAPYLLLRTSLLRYRDLNLYLSEMTTGIGGTLRFNFLV
ncbi:MAG: hypothetical protein DWQ58_09590 [Microcystis aeruginosa TA09]|nr:MAG: hypothetical protein DWQ58_09590 [Microcystis aeruginosa TA09]